jgi:type I restriction-modification system DNA methylase subunit
MTTARRTTRKAPEKSYKKIDVPRFVNSSLFNEALVLRDLEKEMSFYLADEEMSGFLEFWFRFCTFAVEFDKSRKDIGNFDADKTLKNVVFPILDILGYGEKDNINLDTYLNNHTLSLANSKGERNNVTIPLCIFESSTAAKEILNDSITNIDSRVRENLSSIVIYDYFDAFADERIGKYDMSKSIPGEFRDEFYALDMTSRCVEYLNILHKDYGIVTDGARWRILHREKTKEDSTLFYEFDLYQFLELFTGESLGDVEENPEYFRLAKWFYWFFSKKGLREQGLGFVEEVELKSRKYADSIEEDLKTRFVHAITIATNGYSRESQVFSESDLDLDLMVRTSESLVFNLFFLRSCESKGVIPFHQGYKTISLANIVNKIENYHPKLNWNENKMQISRLSSVFGCELTEDGSELYDHIHKLFRIVKDGKNGFGIEGFIETVFCEDEYKIYSEKKLKNIDMANLLAELMFFKEGNSSKQIPYNNFSPRQLGSIYESFLEYKPFKATENLYYLKKTSSGKTNWQWVEKSDLPRSVNYKDLYEVKRGDYIFSPDNKDRKSTGSYYTPHYIVEHMVEVTLGPIVGATKSAEKLLEVKVCDPAMGSAHFLVEVLNYLSKAYTKLSKKRYKVEEVKRIVLDSCIFGADLNVRAVKLAKMSLWLASACSGKKLERLDDQIKNGDSLIALNWKKEFEKVFKKGGFDVIIQNPPYIFARDQKLDSKSKEYFDSNFSWSSYQANTYLLFIEKSFELLKQDGRLAAIIPNNWMSIDTCESFRINYLQNFDEHKLINCKDRIFDGVAVDNSIIFSSKKKKGIAGKTVKVFELENKEIEFKVEHKLDNYHGDIISTSEAVLDNGVLEILNMSPKLGDLYQVMSGLVAYEVGKGDPVQTKRMKDERVYHSSTRKRGFTPYLNGKDVCRYYSLTPTEYLKYGKNLAAPRSKNLYEGPRLLVRQIPSKPPRSINTCLITNEYLNDRNSMIIKVENKNDAYFVMAVLNSEIITSWFIQKYDKFQRKTFPQFKVKELKEFPMLPTEVDFYEEIVENSKKLEREYSKKQRDLEFIEKIEAKLESLIISAFSNSVEE